MQIVISELPRLTAVNVDADQIVLDRWDDSAALQAQPVDQHGNDMAGATITWSSADETIAQVDNAGSVLTWLGGDVVLTVEATLDDRTVSNTVAVTVAVQQNSNCQVPTESPAQGAVAPPGLWDVRVLHTQFLPDGYSGSIMVGYQITLDADRDGDPDVLSHLHSPWYQGVGIPIVTGVRLWLNDGAGNFTDGTNAISGANSIPWAFPRDMAYADFDADGFTDVAVFQHGHEYAQNACGSEPGACPGGPNLLLTPQPGGLVDLAPGQLSPYDLHGFTHSGAAGDIDCDGDIDILESNWPSGDAPAPHRLQVNSGAGSFVSEESRLPDEILPDLGIAGTAFCDLDRDGDPDLVLTLPGAEAEGDPYG
ncbi:MAG: FG-GAP-like repeat-containing protein, partial [Woeseiaceae bacterium]